jgi:hypothetical protein
MTTHSLILSPPEVRAALRGELGLVVRPVQSVVGIGSVTEFGPSDTRGYDWIMRDGRMLWNDLRNADLLKRCPLGVSGDRLRCRESWGLHKQYDGLSPSLAFVAMNGDAKYCVDYACTSRGEGWTGRGNFTG